MAAGGSNPQPPHTNKYPANAAPSSGNAAAPTSRKRISNGRPPAQRTNSGISRFLPLWAWVLIVGAVVAAAGAYFAAEMMKNVEVDDSSHSSLLTSIHPSYPAPTTTGKWDETSTATSEESSSGSSDYGGYYNYAPQQPLFTDAPTDTTENFAPTRPSNPPRTSRPSIPTNTAQPTQAPPTIPPTQNPVFPVNPDEPGGTEPGTNPGNEPLTPRDPIAGGALR